MKTATTLYVGTCHFVSFMAAIGYYADYGYSPEDVREKIVHREIKIGPPKIRKTERLLINQREGRYTIARS